MAAIKHLLNLEELTPDELKEILDLAVRQKSDPESYLRARPLYGKVAGLFFEKPSLRTRLSFEVGVMQLGGHCVYMGPEAGQLGVRESLEDIARVSSRYVDLMVLRVNKHAALETFAASSTKPVINALSDESHPCQALADLLTIREQLGRLKDVTVAFVGDGNNVARSLARGLAKSGGRMILAAPAGYEFDAEFMRKFGQNGQVRVVRDPAQAVPGADVIYTDVWTSMGQETEAAKRLQAFQGYQVNAALIARAPNAIVMHDLPAHRGEEITADVLDGPRAVILDQAENRLHAQRALLTVLAR